jgi:hypothetical protein
MSKKKLVTDHLMRRAASPKNVIVKVLGLVFAGILSICAISAATEVYDGVVHAFPSHAKQTAR